MYKIGVLVSGGGTNLQAIIDAIENGKIKNGKIVTVVSNKPDAYALERAKKHQIEGICISPKDFDSKEVFTDCLIKHFEERQVDLVVLAGYLLVLDEKFVKRFENRIMNIHPSLIPSFCGAGYYGLKVHQAVLDRGVKITGATVHFVDEGTDTGPIILQKAVQVKEEDTPESLQRRVMEEAEWEIYPKAIQLFCDNKIMIKDKKVKILED
ncbi:MAG TPA: phosphoribosylglycinamide formyltransferase [Defluviitaleaceae bacterium]|jgi:phosphoribosylglycinamide formyltransferase-1|nr:phosphoribosylglycinamide formyltransferase [Candidatus Epulonipiscium sp.]HOQ15729.1 phosphoribosylglycinamide formyltransferase [Defluviitaleaceae bacterium]HPT75332.1 phosphoribosylglycinamide formyltransferase [Defluviitaleaceae bacterium]HQD49663.1 phosphoribosylglycinamide formyltransferase [Defluviitaleaceae bacterium]